MMKKTEAPPTRKKHYPAGNGPATGDTFEDEEKKEETEKSRYHGRSAVRAPNRQSVRERSSINTTILNR